jgi:NAD/NADP transhydrogenase beta subunit
MSPDLRSTRPYPWLRPIAGLAAVAAGLVLHWDVLVAAGAVLTVAGVALAAASLRRRSLIGG